MSSAPGNRVRARRVRSGVRRFAIVAFAILLPVATHSAWDYIEIRRLVEEIEAIQSKGEPVSERDAVRGQQPLPSLEHGGASYYLAGSMLALGARPSSVILPLREWVAEAIPNRPLPEQLTAPLQQLVRESSDALMLADKGADLPFAGFPAGTEYSYLTVGVGVLSELVSARTLSLCQAGNGDAAVDSAITALQMRPALRYARWTPSSGNDVAAVLSLCRPTPEALVRLQAALEAQDNPNQPFESFLRERARYVDMIWRRYYGNDPNAPRQYTLPMHSFAEVGMRPWFTHNAVRVLRVWAEWVEVAKMPWPEKARRRAEISGNYRSKQQTSRLQAYIDTVVNPDVAIGAFWRTIDATLLVIDRSSRVAIAVERFRHDRGKVPGALTELVPRYLADMPVDPFSGKPFVYRLAPSAYTIYSVGPNQIDDGGDLISELRAATKRRSGRHIDQGADVGVRVLIQQ